SDYLRQLTNGKYRNIWTPLGERFPKIDDDHGHTLTVSELSSGTREQLFLAIRLAMVERFRNQGVELPIILDDVLVNFDQKRTKAAIETLNAVASKGQQILFFTCHLHLTHLFEEHGNTPVWLPESHLQRSDSAQPLLKHSDILTNQAAADVSPDPVSKTPTPANSEKPAYSLDWSSLIQNLQTLSDPQIQDLQGIGIHTIGDFLARSADQIAGELQQEQLTAGLIFEWQSQARLASCIRGISPAEAALLVSCGITEIEEVATMPIKELWSFVEPCQGSTGNQSLSPISQQRVKQWSHWARQARTFGSDQTARRQHSTEQQPQDSQARREYRRDNSHTDADSQSPLLPPFYLNRSMPVEEAPSIGPKTAHRLERIGIFTIHDLLECNPEFISKKLKIRHINEQTIRLWKKQTKLVCCIPGLRGHDAQILVACGFFEPDIIARTSPQKLFEKVKAFVKTNQGQQIIRNGKEPDFEEVSDWISWSQQARKLHAA
ncbi:MAG: DUF4332 domain-containing protein, partial [Planctomycetaceae bacterium]|nr:DUF4332 domain-containing protein [Planctomycetaceae bacterium]